MAGGIEWFRWYHGSVTDPKFQLIAKKANCRTSDVIAVWAFLLEKASASEFRSHFGEIDFESIDCLLGIPDGTTEAIMEQMEIRNLIADEYVVSWEKRQPKRERSDLSTDRVRKHREAKGCNANETPCNAKEHKETPRVEKRREELTTSAPSGADGKPSQMAPEEIIFGYGVPLLTNAGTPDKQARSFLGGLRKAHGDDSVVDALRQCLRSKPLQPLEWLAAALPPTGARASPKAVSLSEARAATLAGLTGNGTGKRHERDITGEATIIPAIGVG